MKKYAVLERPNYGRLAQCVGQDNEPIKKEKILTLAQLCCGAICKQNVELIEEIITNIPPHLGVQLLREGIMHIEPGAVSCIIANWPLKVLW